MHPDFKCSGKVFSDIVASNLQYKEIQANINDNQITIRIQSGDNEEPNEYRNCKDNWNNVKEEEKRCNKVITIYPNETTPEKADKEIKMKTEDEKREPLSPAENPNIFIFKLRKKCNDGVEKFDIDLDFKVPRPWSEEMRNYIKNKYKPNPELNDPPNTDVDQKSEKKKKDKSKKKNKDKNKKHKKGKKKK